MTDKKYIKILLISLAAALCMSGCNADNTSLKTEETASSGTTAALTPTSTVTPTPVVLPTLPPSKKTDWKKTIFVEEGKPSVFIDDGVASDIYALASNVEDNRNVYQLEFNDHIMSQIDRNILTEEQKDHFFAFCDALWKHEAETPCKDEEEWKLMNRMAEIYHPMISFTDKKTYKDKGSGKAEISYKIDEEEYSKKVFDLKVRINEIVLHSDLREDDPSAVKAYKLVTLLSGECEYDYAEKRHYMYDTFMTGQGICSDFAKVLTYMYLQCGIDAEYISGGVWEHDTHALTAVKGDEDSYYLNDLTWEATFCHYPRFFGEILSAEGRSYESLKIKRVGGSALFDPKDLKLDFKDYRKLVDCYWTDYDCIDNSFVYIDYDELNKYTAHTGERDLKKLFEDPAEHVGSLKVLSD